MLKKRHARVHLRHTSLWPTKRSFYHWFKHTKKKEEGREKNRDFNRRNELDKNRKSAQLCER